MDLIGPYTLKVYRGRNKYTGKIEILRKVQLTILTMMCPAQKLVELEHVIDSKEPDEIGIKVDRTWFSRYPRPERCVHDNGSEFTGAGFQELLASYGIQSVPTTVKNPQANAVLERTHQVIADMLRTYQLTERDEEALSHNVLEGIISNIRFALRSTVHSALNATPGQVVFGRDMLFPTRYVADWERIKREKERRMKYDNKRENAKRMQHQYHVGDLVLITKKAKHGEIYPKLARPTEGPYRILKVSDNSCVILQCRGYRQTLNIHRLIAYYDATL